VARRRGFFIGEVDNDHRERFPDGHLARFGSASAHRQKRKRALLVSYDNCVSAQICARFYCEGRPLRRSAFLKKSAATELFRTDQRSRFAMILRREGIVRSNMAGYLFVIRNAEHTEELGGMDFADDAAAAAFGNEVIADLMDRTAKQYTGWTMEIMEGERAVVSVPFKANAGRKR
jgi:hypothetical protein